MAQRNKLLQIDLISTKNSNAIPDSRFHIPKQIQIEFPLAISILLLSIFVAVALSICYFQQILARLFSIMISVVYIFGG